MAMRGKLAWAIAVVGIVAGVGTRADAGFMPIFGGTAFDGSINRTTLIYVLDFRTDGSSETLQAGDFTTLYDFGSVDRNPIMIFPGQFFTASIQGSGNTPPGGASQPFDDPNINNITFTYRGPTLTSTPLVNFFASISVSGNISPLRLGQYASINRSTGGANVQSGSVFLPAGFPVPEPGSLVLCGLAALTGLGITRLRAPRASRSAGPGAGGIRA